MNRRKALALTAALPLAATTLQARGNEAADKFNLHFAPHAGMFKNHAGEDILDQITYAAEQGFTAWEDNGMPNREPELQTKIGDLLAKHDMKMGVFVANKIDWVNPSLALGAGEHRDDFLQRITQAVEVAKRCNAKWMTVVPGTLDRRQEDFYQFANVVETLKQGAAILEPHGLIMVLEPLNFRDHPNLLLAEAGQAYAMCKAVGSPSCKILFDIYHQQITEGNLIPNIDAAWDEIAYYQIGDNPGRKEPGTGEIHYANVLKHIAGKGFEGIYGTEHGNSIQGSEGETAVIEAYRAVDISRSR